MKNIFIENTKEVEVFERCYSRKLPLLIKGPTGCGKSQFVNFMAEKYSLPLFNVACNEDTNAADLLGRFIIVGGETVWKDGPVTQAAKSGGILYLDEIAEAREDVIVALHPLTDHRREIYLDKISASIKAHENFMLVASYNPGYQKSLKQLKLSTRQRFIGLSMEYLSPNKEIDLICQITNIEKKLAERIVNIGNRIRSLREYQLNSVVSTRLLVRSAELIVDGMNYRLACHHAIAEVLSDEDQIINSLKDIIDLAI